MSDKIIVSSRNGEIRIEAIPREKNSKVLFRTYFRNTIRPEFNLDESLDKLSIQGVCAYFIGIKERLKLFLHEVIPDERERIMNELVNDMVFK